MGKLSWPKWQIHHSVNHQLQRKVSWLWSTVNTRRGYLGQVSTKQPFSVIRHLLYTHSSSVYSGKATWRVDMFSSHPCNYLERLLYKLKSHFYFLRDDCWLSYSVPSLVLYLVLVGYCSSYSVLGVSPHCSHLWVNPEQCVSFIIPC